MPHNVELKARVTDPERVARLACELAGASPCLLVQEDTFFPSATGRLKLRKLSPDRGELIHYERPDRVGPKLSSYSRVPTATPDALRDALAAALGVTVVVRKTRRLWLVGPTRVHLDDVEGLGTFLELEVVLEDAGGALDGERTAHALLAALGVAEDELVAVAYADLLQG